MRFLEAVELKIEKIVAYPETYSRKSHPVFREAGVEGFPFVIVYMIAKKKQEIFIASTHHYAKSNKGKYRRK